MTVSLCKLFEFLVVVRDHFRIVRDDATALLVDKEHDDFAAW